MRAGRPGIRGQSDRRTRNTPFLAILLYVLGLHGRPRAAGAARRLAAEAPLKNSAPLHAYQLGARMLKYWSSLRDLPRPVWVVSASTLVNRAGSMVLSFLVLYLTRERGFSAEHAGFILFLYGVGRDRDARPSPGRLADRWGAVPRHARLALSLGSHAAPVPAGALDAGHHRGQRSPSPC